MVVSRANRLRLQSLLVSVTFIVTYCTVTGGPRTAEFAERFVSTWTQFPPQHPFRLVVIGNGGPPAWEVGALFAGLDPVFQGRENEGGDIGAYLSVARGLVHNCNECAMVCLGESVYFHRAGWLARIAEAWHRFGPGLYGFYASNLVRKHLNTTAFCTSPHLLCSWHEPVKTREQRLLFEHGPLPFWKRVEGLGRPVKLVYWSGVYDSWQWRGHPDEFWDGDQSQCLVWCGHTERFAKATQATKTRWRNNANRGLR